MKTETKARSQNNTSLAERTQIVTSRIIRKLQCHPASLGINGYIHGQKFPGHKIPEEDLMLNCCTLAKCIGMKNNSLKDTGVKSIYPK